MLSKTVVWLITYVAVVKASNKVLAKCELFIALLFLFRFFSACHRVAVSPYFIFRKTTWKDSFSEQSTQWRKEVWSVIPKLFQRWDRVGQTCKWWRQQSKDSKTSQEFHQSLRQPVVFLTFSRQKKDHWLYWAYVCQSSFPLSTLGSNDYHQHRKPLWELEAIKGSFTLPCFSERVYSTNTWPSADQ